MNVKAVVKVMNFHALLRVESSRAKAELYQTMESELENMMTIVTNNRNLRLDKRLGAPDPTKPRLRIYFGSDFGFCGSVNSSVINQLENDGGSGKIIIGKKLRHSQDAELFITYEDYTENFDAVKGYLVDAVKNKAWSAIEIVYNHYYNISDIKPEVKRIYPLENKKADKRDEWDDFEIEDDAGTLLQDMLISYLSYEVMIAAASSYASENTMRQNSTNESLKKLDEQEAEQLRIARKTHTQKAFKKTIDSFIKQKSLQA